MHIISFVKSPVKLQHHNAFPPQWPYPARFRCIIIWRWYGNEKITPAVNQAPPECCCSALDDMEMSFECFLTVSIGERLNVKCPHSDLIPTCHLFFLSDLDALAASPPLPGVDPDPDVITLNLIPRKWVWTTASHFMKSHHQDDWLDRWKGERIPSWCGFHRRGSRAGREIRDRELHVSSRAAAVGSTRFHLPEQHSGLAETRYYFCSISDLALSQNCMTFTFKLHLKLLPLLLWITEEGTRKEHLSLCSRRTCRNACWFASKKSQVLMMRIHT